MIEKQLGQFNKIQFALTLEAIRTSFGLLGYWTVRIVLINMACLEHLNNEDININISNCILLI